MKFFKRRKVITRQNEEPYLIRWNLFECRLFSIKLHRIFRSDFECLHDHPWAFLSIILWGGYVEHREIHVFDRSSVWYGTDNDRKVISRIYHPGQILFRRATAKHKLEIHQPATTLVITFKKVRPWGFWTSKGFVRWQDYDTQSKCE